MRSSVYCWSFLVIAVGLPSQTVHLVGPGGFADVNAALAVAAPGDVVHVEPGQYPSFAVTIPVTIRALPNVGGVISGIDGSPPVTVDVAPGESVQLVNFRFRQLQVLGGRAVLDSCSFANAGGPLLDVRNATAHLLRCSFQGLSALSQMDAIVALNSDLTVVSSTVLGSFGLFPGVAVRLDDARLFGSDLWLGGGSGPIGSGAVPAVDMLGGSQLWLTDSRLQTASGICPIQSSGQLVRLDRCQLDGGPLGAACPAFATGTPQIGVSQSAVSASGVMSPGAWFELGFSSEPNGLVVVVAGFSLATYDLQPLLEQPSWIEFTQSFVVDVLSTGSSGQATYGFTLPNSPSILDAVVWFEGVGGASGGLQVSPLVGGVVR